MSTIANPARRRALALIGTAALSVSVLSACGSDAAPAATSPAAETTAAPSSSVDDHSESTEESSEEEEPTETSAPAQAAAVADGAATITVTVGTDDFTTSGGTRVVSVPAGTDVTVELTDPAADEEYHLHGYDVEVAAGKGETAKVQFTADQTGQFDLESHDTGVVLLVIVVA